MRHVVASRFIFLTLITVMVALPVMADDVTVSGNVTFSSLDGSTLDHDGSANGVFTVNDGNLTIQGTVNCNDDGPGGASACAMAFAVSGNLTMLPGSAVHAENRTGGGDGGKITFTVGGNAVLHGTSPSAAGAIVSSGNSSNGAAGDISFTVGGTTSFGSGSVVSAASSGGNGGAISVNGSSLISVNGLVASAPTRTVAATRLTAEVVAGGSANARGGNITIRTVSKTEPGVIVGSDATIVSQGETAGSGVVLLEGCGIEIRGLVASVAKGGTGSGVSVRSGTTVLVEGAGMLRADSLHNNGAGYRVDVFAAESVNIVGPASGSLFSVNANPGGNNADGGTINVISTGATVTASGNAFRAGGTTAGTDGGSVNVGASGNVVLNGATIAANGGNNARGGAVAVRSYSGAVIWQVGVGDVRPTGSSVSAANRGTITLTYCTSVSTTGSSFPTNGAPVGTFPATAQSCSPSAPSLPGGVALPDCNDPPVSANDAYTVAEGGSLNVAAPGVLGNDVDPDGDPITAVLVTGPAHATSFTLNANGSFSYTHDGSENHSDSFTYRASDGTAQGNVATVVITVTPVNDPPVANNDSYTVAEGGTLNYAAPGVLANDTDPDGPALSAVLVSGPAHAASFVLNPNGSFVYVHNGSETTTDSFTYKASDGSLVSNTATAAITITPVNDAPVANNDSRNVNEGGTLNGTSVLANDTDAENNSLTAVLVSGPAHASSFTLNANGTFTYVHNGSETTTDSFTYKASDGSADSNVATVTIVIAPVNDAPVANNDSYNVNEGATLNGASVLGNDTDAENNSLTAVLVSGPANASSFTLNANGTFTYVHNGSETTSDSFTYKANDGSADSNVATVTITIAPVNDAPVANNDSYNVNEGATLNGSSVLGNDTDAENDSLTATLVSGPAHASSFTFNADGTFTYVHNGGEAASDSFTYKANDGSLGSNVATVTITIAPVNDEPVAAADAYSVNEGGTLNVAAPGVLGNDTDADNVTLTAVLVSGPANAASFTLNANGSFTYVHNGSETTSDSFSYKASDGSADSNVVTVSITINAVNDVPVANNDAYTVAEGGTLNGGSVLGNDTDAENQTLTAVLVSGPANASSFALNPDGTFTYVHNGGETTSDTFTYKATDGTASSNVATVTITITAVNDAPVAVNDAYSTGFHGTLNVPAPGVLGNDTDAEGNALTAVLVSGPAHGTLTLNANGSFTYTHTGSTLGTDSFTYQAQDAFGGVSNTATVTITVANTAPSAANDSYSGVGNTELRVGTGPALTPAVVVSGSVLANDTDPDNGPAPLVVTAYSATSAAGGSVSMNPNGSFSYLPPTGFTGTDSFTYTVSDGVATANATVTIVLTNRVWYVNALSAGAQTGRSHDPFATLGQAQAISAANDYIHVAQGAYTSGIVLKNGQRLIGTGVALVVGPHTLAGATVRPSLSGAILLANTNTVAGLDVAAASNGISGTSVNGGSIHEVGVSGGTNGIVLSNTTGTFTISNVSLTPGAQGLVIAGGTPAVTASNLTVSTSGATGISGSAGSLAVSGNSTIATTGAAAVDLSNMSLNVALTRVDASNAASGIVLSNTTGSFAVNGTGTTAGSGGTISNMSVRGAVFTSATNVTLKNMNFTNAATANGTAAAVCGDTLNGTNTGCNAAVHFAGVTGATLNNVLVNGSAQIGINGNDVNGLTLNNVEVRNAGNELSEHGVQFVNLTGTVSISGSTFRNNFSRQLSIINNTGTLTASITGTTFNGNGILVSSGAQGALISGTGTAVLNVNVQSSTFSNTFSTGYFSDAAGSATLNVKIGGSTFTSTGNGVIVTSTASTSSTYEVTNNTFTGHRLTVMSFTKSSTAGMTGKVMNNVIGTAGVAGSGCSSVTCDGMEFRSAGTATHAVTVSNNQIRQFRGAGIRASASNGSSSLQATISNNTIADPGANADNGIFAQSGAATGDTTSVCADITGNTISGTYVSTMIRVRNRFAGTTFRLPGYAGAGNDVAAVAAFLSGQNGGATASATISGNTFAGGAACATP